MNFFIQFFYIILYKPMLNALILMYMYLPGHDIGVAVILLTILIKLILHPSSKKSMRSQKAMSELQPKIKEIQNKFKDNKAQQTQEMMKLYKEAKVSPMSGCLPLLLQLPILIALYQVFIKGLSLDSLTGTLYSFVPFPETIKSTFLGIIDLTRPFTEKIDDATVYYWPVLILALIAATVQFIQTKKFSPAPAVKQKSKSGAPDFSQTMQKQMMYFLPLLTIFIIVKFGSIIGIYWLTSSLFAIAEHYFINRNKEITYGEKTIKKS